MGLWLLLLMGFRIWALHDSVMILSNHLSNRGIHSNGWPFLHSPIEGLYMLLYLACNAPDIELVPGNVGHCWMSWDVSIHGYVAFYLHPCVFLGHLLYNTLSTDGVTAIAASNGGKSLWAHIEEMMDLQAIVKNTYCKDMICAKIITQPDVHSRFSIWEGLIWMKN